MATTEGKEKKKPVFIQYEIFSRQTAQTMADDEVSEVKKTMLKNLERRLGLVSYAAKQTGITREQHYHWMETDPHYKKQVETLDAAMLDYAEARLLAFVKEMDWRAISFLLMTKGQVRGYGKYRNEKSIAGKDARSLFLHSTNPNAEEIIRLI